MCQSCNGAASLGIPGRFASWCSPRFLTLLELSALFFLLTGPVVVLGCSDDPTAIPIESYDDTPISELTVSPSGAFISGVGSTFQLSAEGKKEGGGSVSKPQVSWSSLNPDIATIDNETGLVTAAATGQVAVEAQGNGASAYALVTVSVPELGPVTGWSFDNEPRPWLNSIWGSSPTDIFAVGSSGVIYHFDGVSWTAQASGVEAYLGDVWGTSATDVFAVGSDGTILHFDGTDWSRMESGTSEDLAGVWGSSTEDVFVVGGLGGILHFDGAGWSPMDSGTNCRFSDVRGSSATDVFVVGCSGTILHYDGSAWTGARRTVDSSRLDELWVNAEDDVYLVGGGIWHFNGSEWSDMDSPYGYLRAVWSAPSGEMFAVGDQGTILRYDGTAWTEMQSGSEKRLEGVWGTSAADVVVVGEGNTILHYDGTAWSTIRSGMSVGFTDIWGASPNDLYAVPQNLPLYHFNGAGWSVVEELGLQGNVSGIWGSSSSDVFVIGVGVGRVVMHYDGSTWEWMSLDYNQARGIWGASPVDVFTVGGSSWGSYPGGIIHRYDGLEWTEMGGGGEQGLEDIWGSSSTNVFVVGDGGTILHFDGAGWVGMDSGTDAGLRAVWGASPNSVFAVGSGGMILHYDGLTWTSMDSGTAEGLKAVAGTSPTDVYAGGGGVLLHFDGQRWAPLAEAEMNVTGASVGGLWIGSDGDVVVVGGSGMILRGIR